jgi:RND family efflux transporter MFP subunit
MEHFMFSNPTRAPASLSLALIIALLVTACGQKAEPPQEARPARVTRAVLADAQGGIAFAGEIRARYESDVSFRIPGKILARTVDLGATVKRGQVLARLDAQDANLNVAAARAALASADSDLEFARAELARYEDLLAKKFVSQGVYDQKQNAYRAAVAKRDSARAQAGVSGNQAVYTTLTADADGVVTAINAEAGQVVAAGQAVLRIARLGEKDAIINVAENQLAQLKANPDAKIALWANPGKLYSGKVREIAAAADATTRTYTVKVALADADDALRWGMSANVGFPVAGAEARRVVMLPSTALTQTGDKAGGTPAVWVVGTDNAVKLVPVQVGQYTEQGVMVTSGLSGGEIVVTAGVHKLQPGQVVKPMSEAGAVAAGATPAPAPGAVARVDAPVPAKAAN